jgi:hypothetical protein
MGRRWVTTRFENDNDLAEGGELRWAMEEHYDSEAKNNSSNGCHGPCMRYEL